jgi:hypothetical protein
VHSWNTDLPEDPEEAAIFLERKRKAAESLVNDDDRMDDWYTTTKKINCELLKTPSVAGIIFNRLG